MARSGLDNVMLKLLKQAKAALARLDPADVANRAQRTVRVGLVAGSAESYARMEESLRVGNGGSAVYRASDAEVPGDMDLVLFDPDMPAPRGAYTLHPDDPDATVRALLRNHEELALPLARRFPGLRRATLDHLIHKVSRENALFAVATALPDVIPSLVELPWTLGEWASDTAFITANQVQLAFLVSAACGHEVGYGQQKTELVSIGLGALGWRALARELAGKVPFGGGLLAKGAIAYAGTYLVGKGLEALHHGFTLTKAEREMTYQQGLRHGRNAVAPFGATGQPSAS